MANFPTSQDDSVSLPNPTATSKTNSPSHSTLHTAENAAIIALEAKVGTGASTPTASKVLRSSGTGTSVWGQVVLSTDVATFTSADLAAILSDETGTGVVVFGTSPTLTTPKIATSINDTNGNEVIKTPATASAVNEFTATNAATGNSPVLSVTGNDTNIDLTLTPKGTGKVKTSPVNGIDWTALPLGAVVQIVTATFSAVATGTTLLPYDDTIPQNTEGDQYMTLAITPKSTTNRLVIESNVQLSHTAVTNLSAALFQDSTANAIAAGEVTQDATVFVRNIPLLHDMVAGTTSSTTFKVRAGGSNAGTTTFNGTGGNRRFGGITTSWIKITEYKA